MKQDRKKQKIVMLERAASLQKKGKIQLPSKLNGPRPNESISLDNAIVNIPCW